ncbi:MAG: carboxypeptidase-like regulatory domain-containing protein [Bacteroidia bacterium]|nr:carboxypeptidase-like regulatory domain-containing protein [Bacteroidia bacterium]
MKKLILLFLFINVNLVAYNQVIKGTIFDNKTKNIIYSASVYFNGTSVGVLSDENGNFRLDISKYRSMPLTISAIGYYSVTLTDFSTNKPNLVYMNPKLFELNEVVVNAKSQAWKRRENLTIFRNEFLGTTGNAMNCEITNENDIRFKYSSDNDTLKAFATKPILVDNKALGYKITYYLDKFEYDKQSKSFLFKGNIIFQEDATTKGTKKIFFEKKRNYAYLGSRMHFFRALWMDDLNSAGFTVRNSANETISYKKIVFQKDSRTKYLKCPGGLGISYYTKQPTSFIIFLKESVFFDPNGYFEPDGITWEGEMARQRIADLVPYEYSINE